VKSEKLATSKCRQESNERNWKNRVEWLSGNHFALEGGPVANCSEYGNVLRGLEIRRI
jgi:hypothetical protein